MADLTARKAWGTPERPANIEPPVVPMMPVASGGMVPIVPQPWSEAQHAAWCKRDAEPQRWAGPAIEHPITTWQRQAAENAERDQREADERLARWGDDPREALRAAHKARSVAQDEVMRRRDTLSRAQQHLDEVRAELAEVEKAERVSAENAARAAALALSHGQRPAIATASLRELEAGQHECEAAVAAFGIVERELAEAETAHAQTESDVTEAAEAVIVGAALGIADRIAALESELAGLRGQIVGIDITWVPGIRSRPIKLPRQLAAAFPITSRAGSETRWADCLKGLLADPEARLPD
jgi:hypothetical protein